MKVLRNDKRVVLDLETLEVLAITGRVKGKDLALLVAEVRRHRAYLLAQWEAFHGKDG